MSAYIYIYLYTVLKDSSFRLQGLHLVLRSIGFRTRSPRLLVFNRRRYLETPKPLK